jgi:hypothetical protein
VPSIIRAYAVCSAIESAVPTMLLEGDNSPPLAELVEQRASICSA